MLMATRTGAEGRARAAEGRERGGGTGGSRQRGAAAEAGPAAQSFSSAILRSMTASRFSSET
jgi:hypothetical protein